MKKALYLILGAILVSTLLVPTSSASMSSNSISSVVQIVAYDDNYDYWFGSGFFISRDGLILTNAHVIMDYNTGEPAEYIEIWTIPDEYSSPVLSYQAEVWVYDEYFDLAIIAPAFEIDDQGYIQEEYLGNYSDLTESYIDLADYNPTLGDEITVLGFPAASLTAAITLTKGTVSSFSPLSLIIEGYEDWTWKIETDATINPGNSGGPAFNEDEKAFGVATEISTQGEGGNYGYIISSDVLYLWFNYLAEEDILNTDFVDEVFNNDYVYTDEELDYETFDTEKVINDKDNIDTERESFMQATAEATCYVLEQENLLDPAIEDEIIEIYEKYGFDANDEEAMEALTSKYENDEVFQDEVTTMIEQCEGYQAIVNEAYEDPGFSDVNNTHTNANAIFFLANTGIIDGYPDGSFKPEGDINRAELTKLVVEMHLTPDVGTYNNCFPDVKTDWYAPYVCYAKEQGWVNGYPDGTFKPANNVSRFEAIKIILNSKFEGEQNIPDADYTIMPIDSDETQWYAKFLEFALENELLDLEHAYYEGGFWYFGADNMTRKEVAEMIYRILVSDL